MRTKRTPIGLVAALAALLALGATFTTRPVAAADGPTVSLGDAAGLERDDVIGSVFMPVTLSMPSDVPVVVSYYTENDTAVYIAPEDRDDPSIFGDYQRRGTPDAPRTVTIPAGSVQGTINIPINVDDEIEDDETFSVTISSVDGGDAEIGNAVGTGTIIDSDVLAGPNPVIHVTSVGLHEGDVGQRRAQFQIHLSRAPLSPVTISYVTSEGSALPGEDYTEKLPGTVVFAPGQISKTIDVLIGADTEVSSSREFFLEVATTGGSPVEEREMLGVATILDDDVAPVATIVPAVVAGNNHTCALDSEGVVKCWGAGQLGQLGDGASSNSLSPVTVTDLPARIASVVAGDSHTCALTAAGGVKCWGNNANGQLGTSLLSLPSAVPADVIGLTSGVSMIEAGDNHTCAALTAGGVRCWGWGSSGQLGNALVLLSSPVPVDVVGIPAGRVATAMGLGFRHSCAAFDDGSARCWGRNNEGQLGNGNTTTSRQAVQVSGVTAGATAVTGGGNHTCIVQNGGAKCFGANGAAQLGTGATGPNLNLPTAVSGLASSVAGVAAGGTHSCSLSLSGGVRCWGLNQDGELGVNDEDVPLSAIPLDVFGLTSGQISLSSGLGHVCAMAADESVRCWGINGSGQLGNGNTARSFTPVQVDGL